MDRVLTYILTKDKSAKDYRLLLDLCHKSKNLYNYTNFIVRQAFTEKHENISEFKDLITEGKFISEYSLTGRFAKIKQADYISLKAQCSQQIVKQVYQNWSSFFKLIKVYRKDKSKFKGVPKLPKYKNKNGLNVLTFTNQSCAFDKTTKRLKLAKNLYLHSIALPEEINVFRQVRIVPKNGYFQIEVIYHKKETELIQKEIQENKRTTSIGIDIGVDNLATITSDNSELHPIIVNGRCVKSINQYFNKETAKLMQTYSKHNVKSGKKLRMLGRKRKVKIDDYFHKMTRGLVNWCILNNVGQIFIGYNSEWKNGVNLGKMNNQKFVQIPFDRFIRMLQYKCEEVGISVSIINEAYTSKCSALDCEEICKHDEFLGKRIHRGLFRTNDGRLINADINGSLNILRRGLERNIYISDKIFNPIRQNEVCDVIADNHQQIEGLCSTHALSSIMLKKGNAL